MPILIENLPVTARPVPACLWQENPYRLVTWWDLMMFDAGRLAAHMMQLVGFGRFEHCRDDALFMDLPQEQRDFLLDLINSANRYCNEVPFPMAAIPLARALNLLAQPDFRLVDLAKLVGNITERLRDEAGTIQLFRIPQDRVRHYQETVPLGDDVAMSFPSSSFDATEAFRSLALGRSVACVFHLMRVLEIGLKAFGDRFGVSSDRRNWHNVIEEIEAAVRNMANDPTRPSDWKDQQEFYAQAASHFMFLKDAWRNYTAHARGKYTDEEAETILINTRAFMQRLATKLHE